MKIVFIENFDSIGTHLFFASDLCQFNTLKCGVSLSLHENSFHSKIYNCMELIIDL